MKYFILSFLLTTTLTTSAQSEKFSGTYGFYFHSEKQGTIEWKLNLNKDGLFSFYFDRDLKASINPKLSNEKPDQRDHQAARGTWTSKKNHIYFHTQEADIDSTYNLNFNNFKAFHKSKHPRDKSNRIIIPSILFLEADVFWIKRLKLDKKQSF